MKKCKNKSIIGHLAVWAVSLALVALWGSDSSFASTNLALLQAGTFEEKDSFIIKKLELVELMALTSGEAPLTSESQGKCRLRLVGDGKEMDVPFSDAEQAREWMDQLMEKARCDLWKTEKNLTIVAFYSWSYFYFQQA